MKYKTIFLDRDGVINKQIKGGYVTNACEFRFLPGVLEALKIIAEHFKHIIIVTNQQGVGKGVFSMGELDNIHQHMLKTIEQHGGRIDKIYVASNLESENSLNRKPGIGMALQAQQDFPGLDLKAAVMVGDSLSDMQFGKKAGMRTVYLTNGEPIPETVKNIQPDEVYVNLKEFITS